MNLHVGTSGYAYKAWRGGFYPEGLAEKGFLHYYAGQFRTVEINNTFYRMPTAALLARWADEVPAGFRFALKVPQQITHAHRLAGVDEAVAYLFDVVGVLGHRLGPLLFQLPPSLRQDLPRLADFLDLLPPGRRVAVEFRHASWFDDEVYALLREHDVALCLAEADTGLQVPLVATADWGYLRLRRPDYGDADLAAWAGRVREQAWRDAYVFFKHEDSARGPALARRFLELAG
jgi:uncharacterized protein YecE (DUF72 family)